MNVGRQRCRILLPGASATNLGAITGRSFCPPAHVSRNCTRHRLRKPDGRNLVPKMHNVSRQIDLESRHIVKSISLVADDGRSAMRTNMAEKRMPDRHAFKFGRKSARRICSKKAFWFLTSDSLHMPYSWRGTPAAPTTWARSREKRKYCGVATNSQSRIVSMCANPLRPPCTA